MIRPLACVTADDISVQCRVRRCLHIGTAAARFDGPFDMICIMRHWTTQQQRQQRQHGRGGGNRSTSPPPGAGPELVLQVDQNVLTAATTSANASSATGTAAAAALHQPSRSRDMTPPQRRARKSFVMQQQQSSTTGGRFTTNTPTTTTTTTTIPTAYSLPLSEILIVERMPRQRLQLTTLHSGLVELDLQRQVNRHDVVLAFLTAHLPSERIVKGGGDNDGLTACSSTCSRTSGSGGGGGGGGSHQGSVVSLMDADRFQEGMRRRHARVNRESLAEKLQRRVVRLGATLSEISATVCDLTACCRIGPTPADTNAASPTEEPRDAPPPAATSRRNANTAAANMTMIPDLQQSWSMPVQNGHLEMDDDGSTFCRNVSSMRKSPQHQHSQPRRASDPAVVVLA